jgi:hypothetical protein
MYYQGIEYRVGNAKCVSSKSTGQTKAHYTTKNSNVPQHDRSCIKVYEYLCTNVVTGEKTRFRRELRINTKYEESYGRYYPAPTV